MKILKKTMMKKLVRRLEVTSQSKPVEEMQGVKGDHIISKGGTEWIAKIDSRKLPCKNCSENSRLQCRKDLTKGIKIEFYRQNGTCVTYAEKFSSEDM